MKRFVWPIYFGVIAALAAVVVLGPWLGLGDRYEFVLYRWFGLARGVVFNLLIWPTAFALLYNILTIGVTAPAGVPYLVAVVRHAWRDGAAAFARMRDGAPGSRSHLSAGLALAAIFITFLVFLSKCFVWYKLQHDQHWWQAMIDYGLNWRTPIFALGGNLLNSYGVELPLKAALLPIEGLAHLFPIEYRIAAAVVLYFMALTALTWVVGALIGLRPVPRAFFAGLLALMLTIPSGLERITGFLPPNFFTHQVILALWWGEAPILMLATAILFFQIGRSQNTAVNIACAVGFGVGAFSIVFTYVIGVIFFVPLLGAYCVGFLITVESRREFFAKIAASGAVVAAMLIARVPQFIINLYEYAFGGFFYEISGDGPVIFRSNFLFAAHIDDLRGLLVFAVAMAAAAVAAFKGSGNLRRIAIATLVCEGAIAIATTINLFVWQVQLAGAFADLGHAPMWASFFILALLIIALVLDQRLALLGSVLPIRYAKRLARPLAMRQSIYVVVAVIMLSGFALTQPTQGHFSDYPPGRPPSIKMLQDELALRPGAPFRGRMMTAVLIESAEPTLIGPFLDVVTSQYRGHLGNDHYLDVLAYNIPILNQYGYWSSPPTFAFSRVFFGREGEQFGHTFFLLTQFNLRMARLVGVRMVVTDAPAIDGGTLVYETKAGDSVLRVFRIDDVNLGQYSPVRAMRVRSASEAIDIMRPTGFDPKHDVIVENDPPTNLVPATGVSVTAELGAALHVRARSSGRSLLVLPIEYSHCLRVRSEAAGQPQIIPVNLQQAGLLFEKDLDARITYRFGLFGDAACRKDDRERAQALDLTTMLIANHRATRTQARPSLW